MNSKESDILELYQKLRKTLGVQYADIQISALANCLVDAMIGIYKNKLATKEKIFQEVNDLLEKMFKEKVEVFGWVNIW